MKERSAGTESTGPDRHETEGDHEETLEPSGEDAGRSTHEPSQDQMGADWDDDLHTLRDEFQELNDKHLRLAAEFNNFRRRTEQERKESWSRAQADLLGRLLDVLDDLQRVADLDLSNATVEAIMEGVDMVERKFARSLADAGVDIIDPADDDFDPELMEAIMRVPADSDDMEDRVAQVFQKGYALKGVLVRPARVSVYKHG